MHGCLPCDCDIQCLLNTLQSWFGTPAILAWVMIPALPREADISHCDTGWLRLQSPGQMGCIQWHIFICHWEWWKDTSYHNMKCMTAVKYDFLVLSKKEAIIYNVYQLVDINEVINQDLCILRYVDPTPHLIKYLQVHFINLPSFPIPLWALFVYFPILQLCSHPVGHSLFQFILLHWHWRI